MPGSACTGQPCHGADQRDPFLPGDADAMLEARSSLHLEAYIFQPGDVASMLVDAMVERAAAGVEVRIVLDAIGSSPDAAAAAASRGLTAAGCQVRFYQPVTWYRLHRAQQPHPSRAAHRGRPGRVHRRCRCGGLVGDRRTRANRLARHDGPRRGTDRGGASGRVRRELARMRGRDSHVAIVWPPLGRAGPLDAMLIQSSPVGSRDRRRGWSFSC